MPQRYIALLRAVNLAGANMVRMDDLRALCSDVGCANVRTLLQSGNVVFDARAQDPERLEKSLEHEVVKRLGVRTDFFIRTPEQWQRIIARNPFRREAEEMPGKVHVFVLKLAPAAEAVGALRAANKGREIIQAGERHLYIVYPDGVGRSRLTSAFIEKALGTRGTGRNWNTVVKLLGAVEG